MTADSTPSAESTVANADMDLVHASKNGDVAAFEQLIKRYDRKLLRIAHHVTHNREDSQDAVQEAFSRPSKIWANSGKIPNSRPG